MQTFKTKKTAAFLHNVRQRALPALILVIIFATLIILPEMITNSVMFGITLYIALFEYPQLIKLFGMPGRMLTYCYLLIPLLCILTLNTTKSGRWIAALTLAFTMINDTAAYLGGSLWGTHPLAPAISPKKTAEGAVIGLFATMFTICIVAHYRHAYSFLVIPISAGISICATLGDLFESYLKRIAHIKDTGTILGGHGGLLDRFDSFLFTIAFAYCTSHWYRLLFNL